MAYDACGNMISKVDNEKNLAKEMAYDSYNRIRAVTDPNTSETIGQYYYDDQGFRVRKLAMAGATTQKEILYPSMYFARERELDSTGTVIPDSERVINNIYMNGVRIAAVAPNGVARFYHTDQVDSVKVVTDDNGIPLTRFEYLPCGETWFQEDMTGFEGENTPKYNSQELDTETNLYYYNARHYYPEVARFVTPDTVIDGEGSTQGWNRFSYVKGNPIICKDPTGHEIVEGGGRKGSSWNIKKDDTFSGIASKINIDST